MLDTYRHIGIQCNLMPQWNYVQILKSMEPNYSCKTGSKNATFLMGRPNWPALAHKTLRHRRGAQTVLLWSQKCYVTNGAPQLTCFDPKTLRHQMGAPADLLWSKNVTSSTGGPNWPTLIQKMVQQKLGAQTDLLWSKKVTPPKGTSTDLLVL